MFHQANIRDLGGGESLFSELIDAVLDEYKARATFPVLSPTMDALAQRVRARMVFDASGARATIGPGGRLTVRVTNAATVPVTGLCTPDAEAYAGQQISYLQLAAGQSITLSLTDCNPTGGSMAAPGGGGTGGARGGGVKGQLISSPPRATEADGCAVSGRGAARSPRPGAIVLAALAFAIGAGRARRRRDRDRAV
jgi:hypothetical protein